MLLATGEIPEEDGQINISHPEHQVCQSHAKLEHFKFSSSILMYNVSYGDKLSLFQGRFCIAYRKVWGS